MAVPMPSRLRHGTTTVSVLPERGALVSAIAVNGVDLLYLEAATLDSPTGAVRGGIPLLFPFAGELQDGLLLASGTRIGRHGFGRRKPWQIVTCTDDTIAMRLLPDADTRAEYPFEFEATEVVTALPDGVRIDLHVENHGGQPLPIAPGWHPYFPCPSDLKRSCLDQVLAPSDYASVDPVACDANIPSPEGGTLAFALPGVGTITLTFTDALKTLEVWTLPGKDFVCIEPWCGKSNAINTADRVTITPGERITMGMGIHLRRS
jgi:galactose mutarotase-like enzyme